MVLIIILLCLIALSPVNCIISIPGMMITSWSSWRHFCKAQKDTYTFDDSIPGFRRWIGQFYYILEIMPNEFVVFTRGSNSHIAISSLYSYATHYLYKQCVKN